MQNKVLIIFFIICNLIIVQAHGNDQINFDVSEIEILEDGNKIIGKNRGSITTNNGILIEADKFEYDKTKNILKAQGNIKFNEVTPYNFLAQNILYNKNKEKIKF